MIRSNLESEYIYNTIQSLHIQQNIIDIASDYIYFLYIQMCNFTVHSVIQSSQITAATGGTQFTLHTGNTKLH